MNCHQVRRPSHPQTHRGSALEERGRQSWAEMDLAKNLVFVHQNSIWPKNTRRTGFSEAWWQWRLPVRWALEILVLLPGESTCCCRSSWALEVILFLAGESPLIRSPSSTRATILGSLMITLLYLCRLPCFLFFLGAPNLSWVSQWIAWNLPLISTNYCPWFFYDPAQGRMGG